MDRRGARGTGLNHLLRRTATRMMMILVSWDPLSFRAMKRVFFSLDHDANGAKPIVQELSTVIPNNDERAASESISHEKQAVAVYQHDWQKSRGAKQALSFNNNRSNCRVLPSPPWLLSPLWYPTMTRLITDGLSLARSQKRAR